MAGRSTRSLPGVFFFIPFRKGDSGTAVETLPFNLVSKPDDDFRTKSAAGRQETPTDEFFPVSSTRPSDQILEEVLDVDAPRLPRRIPQAQVLGDAARRLSSPEYLAAKRRRQSATIADLVRELARHAEGPDFPVWTHAALQELRSLIEYLSDAEQFSDCPHEGNSCEILRQIRDTFLNVGWEHYRKSEVRNRVAAILTRLAQADEVTAEDAELTMDQLLELGLDPAVGLQLSYDQED